MIFGNCKAMTIMKGLQERTLQKAKSPVEEEVQDLHIIAEGNFGFGVGNSSSNAKFRFLGFIENIAVI